MTPSRFRWGILFITIGIILLLNNAGYLDWDYWYELLIWWPLILIAIGIEKIFLRTRLQFISYLAPLILVAAMVYVAADVGADNYRGSFFTSYSWDADDEPDIELIEARVEHGETDIFVNRTSYNLASARFDRFMRKPDIDFNTRNRVAEINICESAHLHSGIYFRNGSRRDDWQLAFSDEKPLKLECLGENSNVNLYLESVPVEELTVENEDGDIYLKIGDKTPLVSVRIGGIDNSLKIKLPSGCGVKVLGDKYGNYLERIGFGILADDYVTNGFDTSGIKVSLILPEELRHFSIDFY
nr:hypothetical protein [candidate division Zixibacteria bacterium]